MTGGGDGLEGVVAFMAGDGVAVVVVVGTGSDGLDGVVAVVVGVGAAVGGGAAVVATGGQGAGHCAGHGCGTGQFGGITQGTHGGWIG